MGTQMIVTYDAKGNKVVLHVKLGQTAQRYETRVYRHGTRIKTK